MAQNYDKSFLEISELSIPKRQYNSTHVFHQYTLKIAPELRNSLIEFLKENNIPVMIYYPVPLYRQEAFSYYVNRDFKIENVEQLCNTVFSLPIHSEIENSSQDFIIQKVKEFFNKRNKNK
jgi:dTDP-4-amino-4,6-dideoxygalactose transaminase